MVYKHYGLSRQSHYKYKKRLEKDKMQKLKIKTMVNEVRSIMPRLGVRKLYYILKPHFICENIKMGRDRLFRFLRIEGLLVPKLKRAFKTTDSNHHFKRYSNLIKNKEIKRSNQVWVSDITYIRTLQGFMYLALITDACSRKIVGYDISDSLELEGCLRALKMAVKNEKIKQNLIHHSDHGVQYCSKKYTEELNKNCIDISMGEIGNCYENALAERVNGILKQEFALNETFSNKLNAINTTKQAVDIYNNLRPHLSIKMKTPEQMHAA